MAAFGKLFRATAVFFGGALVASSFVWAGAADNGTRAGYDAQAVERYKPIVTDSWIFVIDTTSGKTWRMPTGSPFAEWQKFSPPIPQ